MAIPNAALEKLIHEIESQAAVAEQQIGVARTQAASKQREMRLLKLTHEEISSIPPSTGVYEGQGKMFVSVPASKLRDKLEGQMKRLEAEVDKLNKRLVYLETTQKNSREHIEQMLRHGGGK